jgi:hypothetical protein
LRIGGLGGPPRSETSGMKLVGHLQFIRVSYSDYNMH